MRNILSVAETPALRLVISRRLSLIEQHRKDASGLPARRSLLEAHTASDPVRTCVFTNYLDPCRLKRADDLDQCFDYAAHLPLRRFHPLDRGQGHSCQTRKLALVNTKEGTGCPHLLRGNHLPPMTYEASKNNLSACQIHDYTYGYGDLARHAMESGH
ncbi:hypothetical protein FHW96_004873 [Novosphingobium sp. SG751A]|nr:hypothetical protein [Novosphingobium sp. SG751A]